jgi:predicted RNA-binding protein YlqC (UPF0109 family)
MPNGLSFPRQVADKGQPKPALMSKIQHSLTLPLSSLINNTRFSTSYTMKETTDQIKDFLQFIALQFIEHPEQAELRVAEVDDKRISFRLIVAQPDVAILIGRNGFTASAIRNVMKAAALRHGIHASLQINSHEEERQRMAAIEAGEIIDDGSE